MGISLVNLRKHEPTVATRAIRRPARGNNSMQVQAILKGARLSAQKARLVADQVRGKNVEEALDLLTHSTKKGADVIKKLLNSAIANAEHNEGADVDELKILKIYVDEGMTMKRIMPRAKGRADRILKRSCHISIIVADD